MIRGSVIFWWVYFRKISIRFLRKELSIYPWRATCDAWSDSQLRIPLKCRVHWSGFSFSEIAIEDREILVKASKSVSSDSLEFRRRKVLRSKVKKHKNGRFKTVVCLVPAAICIGQINSILSDPTERLSVKGVLLDHCAHWSLRSSGWIPVTGWLERTWPMRWRCCWAVRLYTMYKRLCTYQ